MQKNTWILVGLMVVIIPATGACAAPAGHAFGVYDSANGRWHIKTLYNKILADGVACGDTASLPVIGDYDGDGQTDIGVYNPATGIWNIRSLDGRVIRNDNPFPAGIGGTDHVPISLVYLAEYSGDSGGAGNSAIENGGDGICDPCLATPDYRNVYAVKSYDGALLHLDSQFAQTNANMQVFSADYTGDGFSGLTFKHGDDWHVFLPMGGAYHEADINFGEANWRGFAADFDGDWRADPGVYSTNGNWRLMLSGQGYLRVEISGFGDGQAVPVPGDYNGDGMADLAIYDASAGAWAIRLNLTNNATVNFQLGGPGQIPFAFPCDVFEAPTNVTATIGVHADKVRVSWSAAAGAIGYQVYASISTNPLTAALLGETASTSYDDFAAQPNQVYYYWVKAEYAQGISPLGIRVAGSRASMVAADVKINHADGPLNVGLGTPITVTVRLDPGIFAGMPQDFWIVAHACDDNTWYYLSLDGFSIRWNQAADWTQIVPVYIGPLFALDTFPVLENYPWLPSGDYVFYFATDAPDGVLNLDNIHLDSASLAVL